jgi:penicillin-binding protein A
MVLDYKGVSFSFNDRRRAKRFKRFRLVLLGSILFVLFFFITLFMDSNRVGKVEELLLQGNRDEARKVFQDIESSFFHGDSKLELKALVHLYFAEYGEAQETLNILGKNTTSIDGKAFSDYFAGNAAYRELDLYSQFLLNRSPDPEAGQSWHYYLALAKSALLDRQQSQAAIYKLPADVKSNRQKELAMVEKFNHQIQEGQVDYIFDINDKPLAYYDMAAGKTVSHSPGITFAEFTPEFSESGKFFSLTLNRDIQNQLHRLFHNYHGTFLLFNVSDSSIVAAYSKSLNNNVPSNAVFQETYEPGSIIKLVTMLAYMHMNPDNKSGPMFPFQCKGNWPMDGQIFYDWTTHKKVDTMDDALAVSCNLAFARMGISLGFKSMQDFFQRFYFDNNQLTDLFIDYTTGKFADSNGSHYRLANLAVGLDNITITTFHAALLATIVAQNGSIYAPYMIKNKKNLLNIGYYNHQPQLLKVLENNSAFFKVKNAMVYVVESPDGTGRRSRVEGVPVALKTGTAGNKKVGLDAILTGFFPADKPQYAFAFRLERAGKAEWKGAYFIKEFITKLLK